MPTVAARRISSLEATNHEIHEQLESLLETGKRNEEKLHWLTHCLLRLMDAMNPYELDAVLGEELTSREDIDNVCFLLTEGEVNPDLHYIRPMEQLGETEHRIKGLKAATCETFRGTEYEQLFGCEIYDSASVAMIPISTDGLSGVLAIGSTNPLRFTLGMGTMLLEFFGQVLGRVAGRILNAP